MPERFVGYLNGQRLYIVDAPPPDPEAEFRKLMGTDADIFGPENTDRAERCLDELMQRQPDLMATVPRIGWQRVTSLDISDPEIGCSSR